jgi:choline-sulfatase
LSGLLGGLALIAVCACSPRGRAASPVHPSVLLIAVDTLRADRLGCYGGTRGLTPRIDEIARQGAAFANAFSHAPWTLPAFASILTSRTPPAHGAGGQVGDFHGLSPGIPTLPEQFRAAGYATAAVVNVDFLARPFGVTRGFERLDARAFEDNENVRGAGPTTDAALAWMRDHRQGAFFLMVHYFDAHAEYRPPQPFRRRFAAPPDQEDESFRFGTRRQVVDHRLHGTPLPRGDVERAEKLYDGEVAAVDEEIGRLLDGLSGLGLDENTLVVLTADHGEEFLDHGDWEHGHTLYDELVRVPLLLRQKGRVVPRRIEAAVGHIDLAPTLLAWCGLGGCSSFQGRDLGAALSAGALPEAPLLAYGNFWGPPLASLREGEYQLILAPGKPRELYRWTSDPKEMQNLAGEKAALADELQAKLLRTQAAAVAAGVGAGPRVELTPAEIQRLRAIGYASDER